MMGVEGRGEGGRGGNVLTNEQTAIYALEAEWRKREGQRAEGDQSTSAESRSSLVAGSERCRIDAWRGRGGCTPVSNCKAAAAFGPETRITAMAPLPGGVASAYIVSSWLPPRLCILRPAPCHVNGHP